jgi:Nif-specific regulatory protein
VERHGLGAMKLSHAALRAVEAAEWPGNVRELEHALEAAAVRAAGQRTDEIAIRHTFPDRGDEGGDDRGETLPATFHEATRRFQRELLERTLEETEWNVSAAARRLELARSHVYNLIIALEISRKKPPAS